MLHKYRINTCEILSFGQCLSIPSLAFPNSTSILVVNPSLLTLACILGGSNPSTSFRDGFRSVSVNFGNPTSSWKWLPPKRFSEQILVNETYKGYEGVLRKFFLVLRREQWDHFHSLPLEVIKNTCCPNCWWQLICDHEGSHTGDSLSMENNQVWKSAKKQRENGGPIVCEVPSSSPCASSSESQSTSFLLCQFE